MHQILLKYKQLFKIKHIMEFNSVTKPYVNQLVSNSLLKDFKILKIKNSWLSQQCNVAMLVHQELYYYKLS